MIMRRFVRFIQRFSLAIQIFLLNKLSMHQLHQIGYLKTRLVCSYAILETITGGVISIAIIILFTIIFYRLGIQTANKQIINSSITYQSEVQPESITINFKEGSDFMFAIGVIGFNLSDTTKKYLNITLGQNIMDIASKYFNFTSIPLVQCTPSHFSYNSDTIKFYNGFNISGMLCPPLNYDFRIGGRPTSSKFEALSIYIRYCNNTIDPICANDTQLGDLLNEIGYFSMITPVINTLVNPGEQNYKNIYIEDRNYYYFTNTAGLQLNAQIQQYQIDTDISLMPWKTVQSEYINTIPNLMQFKSKPVLSNLFAQVKFIKSGISTTFARSFNKIDDYLSYVGGLVGTILILFFVLNFYSEKSYLVSIASQIYDISQKSSTDFNFFYFVSTNICKILGICGVKTKWEDSTKFLQAMEEMQKQLSIDFILKKINYLQVAIHSILGQHQIKTIYLSEKKSITALAKERKKYSHPNKSLKSSKIQNIAILDNPDPTTSKQNDLSKQSFGVMVQSKEIQEVDESQNTESHQYSNKQQIENSFKNSLEQVVQESIQGNEISRRIIQKLGKKIYPQIQILIQNQSSKIKIEEPNNKRGFHQQKNSSFMNFQFQQAINP